MKIIFLLLLVSAATIFPQSDTRLSGYWLDDTSDEFFAILLAISKDSMAFNIGMITEGKLNPDDKTISCVGLNTNYEVLGRKMIMSLQNKKGHTVSDTLTQVSTDSLTNNSQIWAASSDRIKLLLIILNDNTIKIIFTINTLATSYSIHNDTLLLKDFGNKKSFYQIKRDTLYLTPADSNKESVYKKL